MKQKWYAYLWLAELLYWVLGLCNILFAWLGLLFFADLAPQRLQLFSAFVFLFDCTAARRKAL